MGDVYQTSTDGKAGKPHNTSIVYNLNMLYYHEPVKIRKVYSGNFQQFVEVNAVAEHKYKIAFPDGSYNYYFYKNGICHKVELYTSRFDVLMKLRNE